MIVIYFQLRINKPTNKQTNKLFLSKKNTDADCYLIPVENKNSNFIPEQIKGKKPLNHF